MAVDRDRSAGSGLTTSTHGRSNGRASRATSNPVAMAVSVLSVLVIMGFGALGTVGSPIYFLGAIVSFVPLAIVAWKAGDAPTPERPSQDQR